MKRRATFALDEKLLNRARAVVKTRPHLTLVGLVTCGLKLALRPYSLPKHPKPVRLRAGRKRQKRRPA